MPIYIAKFDSCDCFPVPDMVLRADNLISALMKCQEMLEQVSKMAAGTKFDLHEEATISGIEEMHGIELMDEEGLNLLVDFWKEVSQV